MHKGRLYELEPRVRAFMANVTYPAWCAKEYDLHVTTWSINTIGAPAPMDLFNVPLVTIDEPNGLFLMYKQFTVGAHTCRMGLRAKIENNQRDTMQYGYLTVDGVEQTDYTGGKWGPLHQWNGIGNEFFGIPIGTASLYPARTGLTWLPVGY